MGTLRSFAFLGLLIQLGTSLSSPSLKSATTSHEYKITKTWDGQDHPAQAEITVEFLPAPEGRETEGFILKVEAPFYDDPKLPEGTEPGRFDELWDYEVVEVFLLGPNEKYLEIELAPSENYLVYYLEGVRNPTHKDWLIDEYAVTKSNEGPATWTGTAFIPWAYLPPCVNKFNAYAIHKSDESRVYMSLFPVAEGTSGPDFHNLEPFSDIDLTDLGLPPSDPAECVVNDGTTTENPPAEQTTTEKNPPPNVFTLTKTWDGQDHPNGAEITIELLPAPPGRETEGFTLKVEAPFYDDPRLPEGTQPGRFDGLWDYEVVELFLLGPNEKYVEIELAPSGNYLVYYLEGVRNPTHKDWLIGDYEVTKMGGRWTGTAFIPWAYLPPCVNKFNAYAIHKSDESRVYMSLFPVAQGTPGPDFHNLEPFGGIDLIDLGEPPSDPAECVEIDEPSTTEENNGSLQLAGKMGIIATLLSFLLSIY